MATLMMMSFYRFLLLPAAALFLLSGCSITLNSGSGATRGYNNGYASRHHAPPRPPARVNNSRTNTSRPANTNTGNTNTGNTNTGNTNTTQPPTGKPGAAPPATRPGTRPVLTFKPGVAKPVEPKGKFNKGDRPRANQHDKVRHRTTLGRPRVVIPNPS